MDINACNIATPAVAASTATNSKLAPAPTPVVGRFAPSPSGRMHLGNVFSCLCAWLSARSQGGRRSYHRAVKGSQPGRQYRVTH